MNEGFFNEELSATQRQGIIICIPKDGRPKQYIKNWRPISLLNNTYKIASACVAQRLKLVLPDIIHKDKTGFLKGRYIGEYLRKIFDLLIKADIEKNPGLLLNVDFEKAFDSVSWSFIHKASDFFGFGPDIKQ